MKTATVVNEIDRKGVGKAHAFTIKANAKAFKILSDGLYSDKIGAIIRELSCNGADSHVAAGCPEKPFLVCLPTRMEPDFVVRDYGVSLTHDQVENVYTTYFESDKTDSNDYIGCLGLGSKSPFSYTDSFTVTAYLNGQKRVYTAYINEEGCPDIVLMGTFDTDEPNGLEVRFGVHSTDHRQFRVKAQNIFRSFNVVPTIKSDTEVTIKPIEYRAKGKNWGLRVDDYDIENGAYVIMGNVRYPIGDMRHELTAEQQTLLSYNIDIECNIGDVEVAASREKISFNDETVKNIKDRLDDILLEVSEMVSKEFEDCENTWQVKCKASYILNDKFQAMSKLLKDHSMIMFNGEKISLAPMKLGKVDPDLMSEKISILEFSEKESHRYRRRRYTEGKNVSHEHTNTIIPSNNSIIFEADIDRGSYIRSKSLINSGAYKRVYLVKFVDDAQKQKFIEAVGMQGMNIDPISSIPSPTSSKDPSERNAYGLSEKAKVKTLVLADKERAYKHSRDNWKIEDVDMHEGGFYIPISRYKILNLVTGDSDTCHARALINLLQLAAGVGITIDSPIVGAKPVILEKFEKSDKWVNVVDYIKEQVVAKAKTITKAMIDQDKVCDSLNHELTTVFENIKKSTKLQDSLEKDTLFWQMYEFYTNHEKNAAIKGSLNDILTSYYAEMVDDYINKDVKAEGLIKIKDVYARYPMIKFMDYYSWDDSEAKNATKAVVAYVNMVEVAEANAEATTAIDSESKKNEVEAAA